MGTEHVVQPDGGQPIRLLHGVPHATPLPRGVAGGICRGVLACANSVSRRLDGVPVSLPHAAMVVMLTEANPTLPGSAQPAATQRLFCPGIVVGCHHGAC